MSFDQSEIVKFFKNQTIFLTGASGFLGKILIEKLLRVCPDLDKIYILVRAKKGKSPDERFNELFDFPCFELLKSTNPEIIQKVVLLIGDCQKPDLGLTEANLEILKKETTCVIHAAANVKFDAPLKEQAENVRGTRDLLELAKSMPKLQVFLYVSTAYSNCLQTHIKEDFYEPPMSADGLFALMNTLDDQVLRKVTPLVLGKWYNTYVYTKSISEDLVRRAGNDLHVAMVRPAIVANTFEEPMPGWIDNFYGVIGISLVAALGVLRCLHIKKDASAHLVPADYVCNCILAAAWNRSKLDQTRVYNYVGHPNNLISWKQYMEILEVQGWKYPTEKMIWYPVYKMRENKLWHEICMFFYHTVVAYMVDLVLVCLGRPTLAVRNYRRLNKTIALFSLFTTKLYTLDSGNVMALWRDVTDVDKKLFNFNMEDMDWDTWVLNGVKGSRLYLLKDTPDTVPRGHRKAWILFFAHYTFVAGFYYMVYKFGLYVVSFFWQ